MTPIMLPLLAAAAGGLLEIDEGALQPAAPTAWDRFGEAVAIDSGRAVVGERWDDTLGTDVGTAFIFLRGASGWTQEAQLFGSQTSPVDQYGSSVAISGDTVAIGAPTADGATPNEGIVYVYVFNGSSWVQQAVLQSSDVAEGDRFGTSVAIDGDLLAVGAMADDDKGTYSGSAYVFRRVGVVWSQQAKLLPSNGASFGYFGTSIAIDASTVLVGAVGSPGAPSGGYVYVESGGAWPQQAYLVDPLTSWYEHFGHAVALDGDTAAIGAPFALDNGTDAGAVSVFDRVGTAWSRTQRLVAGEQYGELGASVALEGDVLAIGAPGDHQLGPDPLGAIYLFERAGGVWGQAGSIQPETLEPYDEFGAAAALHGGFLVVGAPDLDVSGVNAGGARAYQLVSGPELYCFGDGIGSSCPCGNVGAEGQGCSNSTGVGARLGSFGLPGLAADSIVFDATGLVPGQAALLFAANNQINGGLGLFFGDGLRCAGGALVRLGVKAPNASGVAHWGPGLLANLGVSPADVRRFQAWYRDPVGSPCGSNFNLSNGVEVYFVP